MAANADSTLTPGQQAPRFRLADPEGKITAIEDYAEAPGLVVAFLCSHCPYVQHLQTAFARFAADYRTRGIRVVAINPNDPQRSPEDGPEAMRQQAQQAGFDFPYLIDATQDVARAYGAACTPDFFLFDAKRRLVYHGAFDASRPGGTADGAQLRAACDALLAGRQVDVLQRPSVGCSIKWREPLSS